MRAHAAPSRMGGTPSAPRYNAASREERDLARTSAPSLAQQSQHGPGQGRGGPGGVGSSYDASIHVGQGMTVTTATVSGLHTRAHDLGRLTQSVGTTGGWAWPSGSRGKGLMPLSKGVEGVGGTARGSAHDYGKLANQPTNQLLHPAGRASRV